MKNKLKKRLVNSFSNFLVALIICYLIFGITFIFVQKSFIYYPDNQDFDSCSGFKNYEKITHNNTRFYFLNKSDNLIVYYHGNYGSACDRSLIKNSFEKTDNSVIFVEYAGYSNDSRKPSEKLILKDVENINSFISSSDFNRVTVYGQSIGSGPASYHTSIGNIEKLILVNSFFRFSDLVQSKIKIYPEFIISEKYDNQKFLKSFNGNIVIIHAENDKIIPKTNSEILFEELNNNNKVRYIIPNTNHNSIWGSEEYLKLISNIL